MRKLWIMWFESKGLLRFFSFLQIFRFSDARLWKAETLLDIVYSAVLPSLEFTLSGVVWRKSWSCRVVLYFESIFDEVDPRVGRSNPQRVRLHKIRIANFPEWFYCSSRVSTPLHRVKLLSKCSHVAGKLRRCGSGINPSSFSSNLIWQLHSSSSSAPQVSVTSFIKNT